VKNRLWRERSGLIISTNKNSPSQSPEASEGLGNKFYDWIIDASGSEGYLSLILINNGSGKRGQIQIVARLLVPEPPNPFPTTLRAREFILFARLEFEIMHLITHNQDHIFVVIQYIFLHCYYIHFLLIQKGSGISLWGRQRGLVIWWACVCAVHAFRPPSTPKTL
jgi:hypothetical protein